MIECKKVSFSYPSNESIDGEREVHGTLKNIDLSISCCSAEHQDAEKLH